MQDFLDTLYAEIENIFTSNKNKFKIIEQDGKLTFYRRLVVNLFTDGQNDRFLSEILPIMKKYNIFSVGCKNKIIRQYIIIRKTTSYTDTKYITISFYEITRSCLEIKETDESNRYDISKLYKTLLFYNDGGAYVKNGENGRFYPCSVNDVLCFPEELQSLIFKHYSSNSLFYKDILREKFNAPIKLDELNTYHSKKEYLEKIFQIQLPTSINKKDIFESYAYCCVSKYIKTEQLDYLFSFSGIDKKSLEFRPTLRDRKIIAQNTISSILKSRNPTLNMDVIRDYITYSFELKHPIDILAGKRKIQRYHDELTDRMIKKSLHGKKLVIPDTPLKYLKLPKEFRLLNSKKALIIEGQINHNCVGGYVNYVNKGKCVIYSADINGEHLTIEIKYKKSRKKDNPFIFFINQCYRSYNRPCSTETYEYVLNSVQNASSKAIDNYLKRGVLKNEISNSRKALGS